LCTGHRGDRLNSPIHGIPPPLAHPSPPLHPTIPVIAFSPHQSTQGAVIFALGSEHKTPWLCPPSLWLLTLAVWVFLLCTDRFSFLFAMDFRPGFHLTKSPFFNCPAPKRRSADAALQSPFCPWIGHLKERGNKTVWALIAPCLAFPHFFSAETPAIFGRYLR
jgi:hypothetical protein